MSTFPPLMSQSIHIRVGEESKSPYQWAAKLIDKVDRKETDLVTLKNAMLWLEGETFSSEKAFLDKAEQVVKYQTSTQHVPTATLTPKQEVPEEKQEKEDDGGGWVNPSQKKKAPRTKEKQPRWTVQQLAVDIVDRCVREMDRVLSYTGPSLSISEVYSRFEPNEFTYQQLIGAIRDEIKKHPTPFAKGFSKNKKARFWAETSAGKARDFNFKVQEPDSSKPNGFSASAQIHVHWQ